MTLTVRLRPDIESALNQHCAERGVTKSLMVQEMLARYLVQPDHAPAARAKASKAAPPVSANYRAFEAVGLIGCVAGVGPADKAGVRAAFARRQHEKQAARAAQAGAAPETAKARTSVSPAHPARRGGKR